MHRKLVSGRTVSSVDQLLAASQSTSASWANKYPWMSFAFDDELKTVYNDFISANQSWVFQLLMSVLHFIFFVPVMVYISDHSISKNKVALVPLTLADVLLFLLVFLCGIFLLIHVSCPGLHNNKYFQFLSRYKLNFQAGFIIGFNVANCLYIVQRLVDSRCIYTNNFCDSITLLTQIPNSNRILNILLPMLCITVLREWRITVILVSWIISMIVFVVGSVLTQAKTAPISCFLYAVISAMIIVEVLRQNFRMFLASKKLEDTMRENEELAAQEKASDLRHMIANVAHDLKTPLSSFMVGTELIQQLVDELLGKSISTDSSNADCKQGDDQGTLLSNSEYVRETLQSIRNSLHDISITNAFMVMTINRCIDYTKASKGMKLTPKNETVEVLDAVSLPLLCMRNVQQKVSIVLSAIPHGLCSHIVTDKQWLQENILCLLSNASKYSDGGTVTVTLSLVSSSSLEMGDKVSNAPNVDNSLSKRNADSSLRAALAMTSLTVPMQLMVEIQDEGIGVPDELMASLFNPFKQTQKLAGGTGLGLYSLAKRVEALQGCCGVRKRSDDVRGSVFWFSIPYRPDELFASEFGNDCADCGRYSWISSVTGAMDETQQQAQTRSLQTPQPSYRREWTIHSSHTNEDEESSGKEIAKMQPLMMPRPQPESIRFASNSSDKNDGPVMRGSPRATLISSSTPPSSSLMITSPSLNILLAEDSPTISKVQMMMLKKQGHRVTLVENGAMAVRAYEDSLRAIPVTADESSHVKAAALLSSAETTATSSVNSMASNGTRNLPPLSMPSSTFSSASSSSSSSSVPVRFDVVLMDLQMPVMDGLEAVRRIRAFEQQHLSMLNEEQAARFLRQKIVGVSANSDAETVQEAFAVGIDAFLPKPFTQKALEEIVRSIRS